MSWPPFRCVVDSHPPAVSVCRSARGRPHLRRTPVSFRPASRISTKHAGRRRGKRVSAVSSVFLSLRRKREIAAGILGPLAAISGISRWRSRPAGDQARLESTQPATREYQSSMPPRWMAVLPAAAATDTATTATGEQQPASWLSFRLLPQPLLDRRCMRSASAAHRGSEDAKESPATTCRRLYSRILDKGCEWSKPDRSMKRSMQAPSATPFPDALSRVLEPTTSASQRKLCLTRAARAAGMTAKLG